MILENILKNKNRFVNILLIFSSIIIILSILSTILIYNILDEKSFIESNFKNYSIYINNPDMNTYYKLKNHAFVRESYISNKDKRMYIEFKDLNKWDFMKLNKMLDKFLEDTNINHKKVVINDSFEYSKMVIYENMGTYIIILVLFILLSCIIIKITVESHINKSIKDIAIFQTVGGTERQIKYIFYSQGFYITVISFFISYLIVLVLKSMINSFIISELKYHSYIDSSKGYTFIICIIISILVYTLYLYYCRKNISIVSKESIYSRLSNPFQICLKKSGKIFSKRLKKNRIYIAMVFIIISTMIIIMSSTNKNISIATGENTDFKLFFSETEEKNSLEEFYKYEPIIQKIELQLHEIEGIKRIYKYYTVPVEIIVDGEKRGIQYINKIENNDVKKLEKTLFDKEMDTEKFKNGSYICVHREYAKEYNIRKGDTIRLRYLSDKNYRYANFKVLELTRSSPDFGFIYCDVFDNYKFDELINDIEVTTNKSYYKSVEDSILKVQSNYPDIMGVYNINDIDSNNRAFINIIFFIFILIIILSGFITTSISINKSADNIINRGRDFMILFYIGATEDQIRRIIQLESKRSFTYPAIIGFLLGVPVSYLICTIIRIKGGYYIDFKIPWILFFMTMSIIYLISIITSKEIHKTIIKYSNDYFLH